MSNSKRIFGKDYNDYLLAARRLMQGGVRVNPLDMLSPISKVSCQGLLMLPAQPLVIILYLHNEKILKRFYGNAIIHIVFVGIYCSKKLLTTKRG